MTRRLLIFVLAAIALCAPPAGAWLIGKPTVAAYTGPGDYAAFTAWYGLRAYSAAKAAAEVNAIDLRRVSDSATCTVKVATNGTLDLTVGTVCNGGTQTVTDWIGASSATVSKIYDQTAGNACGAASCDLVQATAAAQPDLILNCNGSLPCLRRVNGGGTQCELVSANTFAPASKNVSISTVANRVSGGQFSATWMMPEGPGAGASRNGIRLTSSAACGGSPCWTLTSATGDIPFAATDAAWHAANGAIATDPATSTFNIDGVEATTTGAEGATVTDAPTVRWTSASATLTVEWAEGGFQDNTVWSGTIRTNLCHNQRLYWNTGGSC